MTSSRPAMSDATSSIPIFVVSYNNGFLVRDSVQNLRRIAPDNPITILDNASTSEDTQEILTTLDRLPGVTVHRYGENRGPWRVLRDPEWARVRNDPFVLTDPDLEFSTLPRDALERLRAIQLKHRAHKVGLALDISATDDLLEGPYLSNRTIHQWESQFWRREIEPDLFLAPIDTTFCLYDYAFPAKSIRVAGALAVRHLPWHRSFISSLSRGRLKEAFGNRRVSSTNKLIWRWIVNNQESD